MTFPQKKPKREHDPAYLAWIRQLPCIASACEGSITPPGCVDAAHVSFLGQKGFGSKVSDCFAVPLHRAAHSEQHSGNERLYWARLGVDPRSLTEALSEAYPDVAAGTAIILDYADRSRRTHRLRPAGELSEPTDAAPKRVTLTCHLSNTRDVNGNVGIHLPILGDRGCSTALVHVDPSAVEETR
jgi:hypothetical protein